jgi:hypothetical protein
MKFSLCFAVCLSVGSALGLSAIASGSETSPRKNVLLVVPEGASIGEIQRVRSAVPPSFSAILVGKEEKISVREGVSILVDKIFAGAGPADAVVVLPGQVGDEILAFLASRRESARIIVFLGDSPVPERLRQTPGHALIVTGSADSLPALLESTEPRKAEPPPAKAAPAVSDPKPTGSVFDRYFSTASSASRRPKATSPN